MGAAGSDKAFAAIMKWSGRDEWQADCERVIEDHLGPVCDALELTPDQIAEVLGDASFFQVIACAFEDFLTCDFEPNQRNVVDDYLKRRGWKESAPVRRYLKALKKSVIGIYEVTGATPDSHFFVRDLVRGGEPIRVEDKLASSSLLIWDRIAARLLVLGGKTYVSGAMLWLSFADARRLLERIIAATSAVNREVGREARRLSISRAELERLPVEQAVLSEAAPAITGAWLLTMLRRALRKPRPGLTNSDGEPLILSDTHFPLTDPARSNELEACLDEVPELTRELPQRVWIWLEALPPVSPTARRGKAGTSEDPPPMSERILGVVHLEPGVLRLETNSAERARRGGRLLSETLQALIGPPLTSTPTPGQAAGAHHAAHPPEMMQSELPLHPGDPEAARQQTVDAHYRATLSASVPMLGCRTPKQAVRSKSGRRQVVEWLKYLENQEAHRAQASGETAYDFVWLWQALGIAAERK